MFVLTCPSCGHAVKTRFARLGATATCPSCKKQYKVDEQSLAMEAGAEAGDETATDSAAPAQEPKMASEPVEELKVKRAPLKKKRPAESKSKAAAKSQSSKVDAAPTDSSSNAPAESPPPAEQAVPSGSRRAAAERRLRGRRRRRGLDMKLVAAMLILFALLTVVIVVAYQQMTKKPDIAQVDQSGPSDRPVPPELRPEPVQPRPAARLLPDLPVLELTAPALSRSNWTRLSTPVDPITPSRGYDVVLWDAQLMRYADGDRAIISGMYVAESPRVYRRGVLRVQLLNENKMVYAELQTFVPVVCSRGGMQMRIAVPADLVREQTQVVCEFTPIDAVLGGLALQMAPEQTERVGDSQAPVLKLAVHNPHDRAVVDPQLVVELMTADGYPLGTWQGTLDGRVEPNQTLIFQAAPKLDQPGAIGRVQVRGYGQRSSS